MIKVFHFSNKPPFPLKDGGCVAIAGILRSLLSSKQFAVFHFTLKTHKHGFNSGAYPKEWTDKMGMASCYVNTRTSGFGAVYHLIQNKSYNVARFYDKNVVASLEKELDNFDFDVAILESIYLLPYLDCFKKRGIKVVVRTHNLEHQIWSSMAKNSFVLKRLYYQKLSKQLKEYEEKQLQKVDGILAISEEDGAFFKQFEPAVKTMVLPVASRTDFPPANYQLSDFYFLGAMDWKPNIEGIKWLLSAVFPEGFKEVPFYLAGRNLKPQKYNHPGLQVVGEVDNAVQFINTHGICVIPLLSGSGVKVKLLENMAMGKPIITTVEGVRGVNVTHGEEVLISKSPEEFKSLMMQLHSDKALRTKLGKKAKKFIQDNYGHQQLTKKLLGFIKEI